MRWLTKIIVRVVEAGLHIFWKSQILYGCKLRTRKIGIVQTLDEYFSFSLYHMQPAFYLLLIGWCLSALCFMFEVLYNRFLSKRFEMRSVISFLNAKCDRPADIHKYTVSVYGNVFLDLFRFVIYSESLYTLLLEFNCVGFRFILVLHWD